MLMARGVEYVMTPGMVMILEWSADNYDTLINVSKVKARF